MSEIDFYAESGRLFAGGTPVDLPYAVVEILRLADLCVVRVEPPASVVFNRNVFAVATHGVTRWQIAESPHGAQLDKPYMNITCDKDGRLIAGNWIGIDYLVGLETGEVSAVTFNR